MKHTFILKQRPCGDWVIDCTDCHIIARYGVYQSEQLARDVARNLRSLGHSVRIAI
jgi:hypothetical protein